MSASHPNWRRTRLKYTGRVVAGGTPESGNTAYWDGGVTWLTPVDLGNDDSRGISGSTRTLTEAGVSAAGLKMLPIGSVVFSTRAPIGSVGLLACEAVTNQGCKALVPNENVLDSRFGFYLAIDAAEELQSLGLGTTFLELSAHGLKNLGILIPSIAEQRRIAVYLDEAIARIDRLLALRRQQMELLRKQHSALIQQAVTRGLDPGVPLKDSGLQRLGSIPAHWQVMPFKFVTHRVDVGIAEAATHAYVETGVPIVRSTNVRANKLDSTELLYLAPWFAEKNRSKFLRSGDIVTTRTGNAGVSAVIPDSLDMCQCFTMLISTLRAECVPEYFCQQLNCHSGQTYFSIEAWGTAQDNISVPILKDMPVVVPPTSEQAAIVEFVHGQSRKLNMLSTSYSQQVDLLLEYRAALIHECVTGQRAVPAPDHTH